MVSRTASTCNRYAAGCTKTGPQILRSEKIEKEKTHPEKPKKGKTGCVLGAGGDGNGWEWVKPDGKPRKARRKSRDGLVSAAASVGASALQRCPPDTRTPNTVEAEVCADRGIVLIT